MWDPNPLLPGERTNREGLLIVTVRQLALLAGCSIARKGEPSRIGTGRVPAFRTLVDSCPVPPSVGFSPASTGFPTRL
jgi:hypothetical protein